MEEDGDKTDDGRYYYFGIYIMCICVIYAMDFSMNMYNISYLYYWSFIEINRLLLCTRMKCKVCSYLAKQVADKLVDLSYPPPSV